MTEPLIFLSGIALGSVITAALLILYGQWLFASGTVFRGDLTPHEERLVMEERLRELAEWAPRAWPTRRRAS